VRQASVDGGHADANRVIAVLRLNRLQAAIQHFLAAEDHEDRVAHAFGDIHIVCRKDHGRTFVTQGDDRVLEHFHVDRVQAAEGFVQHNQLRLRDDGGDELDLL